MGLACAPALACTAQEATAKRSRLGAAFQALLLNHPGHADALVPRMRALADLDRQDKASLNWNRVCAEYDRAAQLFR